MKWDEPPLWPIALPSGIGFLLPLSSTLRQHKFDALHFITTAEGQESLITPLIVMIMLSPLLIFAPKEIGNRIELIAGSIVGLLLCMIPQVLFKPWLIVVILFWIFQSRHIWSKNYPPFRIGIWLGLGGASGLFLGGFFAYNFL